MVYPQDVSQHGTVAPGSPRPHAAREQAPGMEENKVQKSHPSRGFLEMGR